MDFEKERSKVIMQELEKGNQSLARAKRELEVSRKIMHYMHEDLEFESLLKRIIKDVRGAMDFDNISLYFVRKTDDELKGMTVDRKGTYNDSIFEISKTDVNAILSKDRDAKHITLKPDTKDLNTLPKNLILAPLIVKDEFLAVLVADRSQTNSSIRPDDLASLTYFADTTSTAVENFLLYAQTEKELAKVSALYKTAQAMTKTFNIQELFISMLNVSIDVLNAKVGSIWMMDDQQHNLVCKETTAIENKDLIIGTSLALGVDVLGKVAQTGKAEIVKSEEDNSMICSPLILKGKTLGVIQLLNKKNGRDFSQEDLSLLTTLAAQMTVSVDNISLYENLEIKVKERTKELEQSEKERIDFFNNMSNPSFLTSPEGIIKAINPIYQDVFEVRKIEVVGKHIVDELISRGMLKSSAENLWKRLQQKGEINKAELVAYTTDKKKIYLEITAIFTKDGDGDLNGVQGVLDIITNRRKLQLSIRKRTRDLEKLNSKLQVMDNQKDEFLSYVSHELRTPITSVLGYSSLMINDQIPEESKKESLSIIHEESPNFLFN